MTKKSSEEHKKSLNEAYDALCNFYYACSIVRSVDDIDNGGHWIISKDEAEQIRSVLALMLDCGATPEF